MKRGNCPHTDLFIAADCKKIIIFHVSLLRFLVRLVIISLSGSKAASGIYSKEGRILDKLTNIVRDEISRQYKSVRQFAFAVGIPLSTINSALHNGIGGSSFDTVVQICRTLGICALGEENIHLTEDTQRILDQYAKLDDYGRHTIASVIQVEYDRCTKTFEDGSDLRGGYSSVNLSAPVANDEPVSMNVLASRED